MIELTFVADALTPVAAYAALRAAAPGEPWFLLESVVGGERWGRYSILGYRPRYEARLAATGWTIVPLGDGSASAVASLPSLSPAKPGDPLGPLASLFSSGVPNGQSAPSATRSVAAKLAHAHVGFFAWDLVHALDKVPGFDAARSTVPRARLLGGGTIVVFDALAQTVTIAAETQAEIDRARRDLDHAPKLSTLRVPDRRVIPDDVEVGTDDETFRAAVEKAQTYIQAGDAFQIVISRTFSVPRKDRDPFDVYRAMRLINPSPYMYFLDFPTRAGSADAPMQIAGASPETLVRREAGKMTVRPIAGTRPRGKNADEDAAMEAELRADAKENAEHVMLIDLGRNDVGRVADVGTVRLLRQMEIERYSHVMHLVSEVEGRVPNEKVASLDVLRAAFPAGTLSGAPKVRAMQIIRELEDRPRGIYGGAVGYLADNGDLDLAIAIRTAVFHGDRIDVTAGAGIVDASDPHSEAEETRSKARGVLCAIEAASTK